MKHRRISLASVSLVFGVLLLEASLGCGSPPPPGPAVRLAFTTVPQAGTAGAVLRTLAVSVQDAQGSVVPGAGASVRLAIGSGPPGAVLQGTTTVQTVNGVARFTDLVIAEEGTGYTLMAAADGLASATSEPFDIIDDVAPAQPALSAGTVTDTQGSLTWTAVGDDGTQGTAAEYDLRYATTDITSDAEFAAATRASTSAPLAAGSAEQATLNGLTPDTTYYVALKVTDNAGNSARSATIQLSTQPPPTLRLAFIQQPQNGVAGTSLATIQVAIQDASGTTQAVDGTTVTLTLQGTTGFGPFSANSSNGVATFDTVRVDTAGTGYTLTASASGVAAAISQAFDVAPDFTTRLVLSAPSNSYPAGAIIPLEVSARDLFDNRTPSYTNTIVFSSGDPDGDVPVDYTFTPQDAGRHTFNIILRSTGLQTVAATDLFNGGVSGSITFTLTPP